MAIEEGLNVKLVLIPDNEDPDSYVNKVGTEAFKEFISINKKDFIIFQLEIMMKDAANDINKKNEVVNTVAATLSKINKAEDFTKQQEYIKQCAHLLKIDEGGLINLVNKYRRDSIVKEEKKLPFEEANTLLQQNAQQQTDTEDYFIASNDEVQEKNIVRVLLEKGLKKWNDEQTIAEYIFNELEAFQFDNKQIENLFNEYKSLYEQGAEPAVKSFLYHTDEAVRNLVIAITVFPFELSQKWDEVLEGMNIVNRDVTQIDAQLSVAYFKLKKIKKMLEQNQADMEHASFNEQLQLIKIHEELKQIEMQITKNLGSVILSS